MNFVHLKIFSKDLNVDSIRENLLLSPDFVYTPSNEDSDRKAAWSYTEEVNDKCLNGAVEALITRLYEKREFFSALTDSGADIYFVIAYYVESYQGIITVDSGLLRMLGEMNIEFVVDIMAP